MRRLTTMNTPLTDRERRRIVELYTAGKSMPEVRAIVGRSLVAIRDTLIQRGVKIRPQYNAKPRPKPAKLLAMRAKMSAEEMALQLEVTSATVNNWLRAAKQQTGAK